MNLIRLNHQPGFPSLLNHLFRDYSLDAPEADNYHIPATNVLEKQLTYELEIALPGIDKKEVSVHLDEKTLSISAETKKEVKEEENQYTRREFSVSAFKRSFTLPEDANSEKIQAEFKNGILHLSIPKHEEKAKLKKQIEIS